MTTYDDKFRPLAHQLITKFGKLVTIKHVSTGSYDLETGSTTDSSSSQNVRAVIRAPSIEEFQTGLAKQGDRYLVVDDKSLSSAPHPGDLITIDSADWQILTVNATFSGEKVALYTIHARK